MKRLIFILIVCLSSVLSFSQEKVKVNGKTYTVKKNVDKTYTVKEGGKTVAKVKETKKNNKKEYRVKKYVK